MTGNFNRLIRGALLALPLLIPLTSASAAAEKSGTEQIIDALEKRLTLLQKQYNPWTWYSPTFASASKTAVREAAIDLRRHLEQGDNRQELLADAKGNSPLAFAAVFGLSDLVAVMLEFPEARAQVDIPLPDGQYLWSVVSNLPAQSWMVCGDGHMIAGFVAPFLGYLGFESASSPHRNIRRMLEEAGAVARPAEARDKWLKNCDPSQYDGFHGPTESSPGVRQRVADAPDIQEAILSELETLAKAQGWIQP